MTAVYQVLLERHEDEGKVTEIRQYFRAKNIRDVIDFVLKDFDEDMNDGYDQELISITRVLVACGDLTRMEEYEK